VVPRRLPRVVVDVKGLVRGGVLAFLPARWQRALYQMGPRAVLGAQGLRIEVVRAGGGVNAGADVDAETEEAALLREGLKEKEKV
jgi:hypothetical protein